MSILKKYPYLKDIKDIAKRKRVEIFLVGGFLRDHVIGRACLDFDFAVEKDAIKLAQSFARKIKGAFVLLDEDHGCARVVKKIKGELATFDFADYRAKTLRSDLSHRDFTINTLSLNVSACLATTTIENGLLDYKKGQKDIKDKTIRMVSSKVFKEDPLRLMRAFSLRAVLDFKIEKATQNQIKKDKDLIRSVSAERIREELFKILASANTKKVLAEMDRGGLLEKIMPQVAIMYNVKQGTYHHLDVWPHSLETVAQVEGIFKQFENNKDVVAYLNEEIGGAHTRRAIIKLACLLHDIGKPETRKKENNRLSFHGHEHVGKNITKHIAKLLKVSTKERYALEDMVQWHLRPGYLSNFKKPTERAIFRYFRDTKDEAVSILLLSLADQRSTRGPLTSEQDQKHHEDICLRLIDQYFVDKKKRPFVRLISGADLIKKLKLKPSPIFSKILQTVEEKQVLGKIKTKSEALQLAKKIAKI